MSNLYAALPLDEEIRTWLRTEGVACPDTRTPSRWPTPRELRSALESLAGYSVSYRPNGQGAWDADVTALSGDGWHATIWTQQIADDDTPVEFSFHKPDLELALVIVEKLSHVCGPFLFVDASSVIPVVVAPGSDTAELAARYYLT